MVTFKRAIGGDAILTCVIVTYQRQVPEPVPIPATGQFSAFGRAKGVLHVLGREPVSTAGVLALHCLNHVTFHSSIIPLYNLPVNRLAGPILGQFGS